MSWVRRSVPAALVAAGLSMIISIGCQGGSSQSDHETAAAPGRERAAGEMPPGHPSVGGAEGEGGRASAGVDLAGIEVAEGGKRVAEIFATKAELEGKEIAVRGKVVKFTPAIMGTNWLHLRDGTGKEGTNDLTVTTSTKVKTGDLVLVKGRLTVGKDFGYGYEYEVIIENGEVTVE